MYGTILTSWSYLLCYSVSHYFIPTASTVYSKNIPPHPPVSLCLSLKCMRLWWESIHGFNGFLWPFFQDLGDVFKKRKRGKLACPDSASKSVGDCRGQHFCLHQKNEKFSAYKTGRTSQYGSESWLTSIPCEKKDRAERSSETSPNLLRSQTWRQIRK